MNPIVFALRRPFTVMVLVAAVVVASVLALGNLLPEKLQIGPVTIPLRSALPTKGMAVDLFPDMGVPIIYVAQPYGGMDPGQMEGFLTNYFEYHFLYITGIHHVESKNIQGMALMKLVFHPGTNMAQAMAETVSYVNRARSFMPPGTVPPFIMRFDAGSVPVGYMVFESDTKTIGEIQDAALFRVRPLFANLPGVSAPPPFGGNQRSIIITVQPEDLRRYNMSPDQVVQAVAKGNIISPSGSIIAAGQAPMVPINSVVTHPKDLEKLPVGTFGGRTVYLRDLGKVEDGTDIATGYGLVNGKRSVYILVTKRADASTLSVVNEVKANLDKMRAALPEGITLRFEFDQSGYITRALWGLGLEGLLGALLTGVMVFLFLRDWRSVIVVVLNIPFALLGAVVALWLTGQTINLMTLGGLALAIGILVDESTVEVENIHTQMDKTGSIARAVRLGNAETALPRLLAMLCILAVFIPSFFMEGSARALFVPLSLAVGFAMVASYLLSSTFVPVISVWLLRHYHPATQVASKGWSFARIRDRYAAALGKLLGVRWLLLAGYGMVSMVVVVWWLLGHPGLGMEIFPAVDAGQFQMRIKAPDGTPLLATEELTKDLLDAIADEVGPENVDITVTLVGTASYNYPINSIYLWTVGPQEAVLRVALKRGCGINVEELKERLRESLPKLKRLKPPQMREEKLPLMRDVKFSFEAGDIVSEVMSLGSPTPIEIAVSGPNLAANRGHAEKIKQELEEIVSLRDLQIVQSLDYPTINVQLDRQLLEKSGGVTVQDAAFALRPFTLSSRFVERNYWRDPKSGIGYQVQIQMPQESLQSVREVGLLPIGRNKDGKLLLLRDVAKSIRPGTAPGEYDRFNMRRVVSLSANIVGEDLGRVGEQIQAAIARAGKPPHGVLVDVRGQITPMKQMFGGLAGGMVLAIVAILLLLTANFQSVRLSLVVLSTVPAVLVGVLAMLVVTGTTLNVQSYMGAIMAIGVAVANAILLVTFAERDRMAGATGIAAVLASGPQRLRPILMTSFAMIAGMIPLALALGEGGEQTAPLGRAVIGGLVAATLATLFILPAVFALVQDRVVRRSRSLDPDDPQSALFEKTSQ